MNKSPLRLALFVALLTIGIARAKPRNVLLLCIDDLRPELKSFGASHIKSPNIDRLAGRGRAFHRHYVNAPSCGPSRFTLLTGRYGPAKNDALFTRAAKLAKDPDAMPPSMPEWFRKHGYTTVSVGKVSHHPGGLGGPDWNDPARAEMPGAWDRRLMPCGDWRHPRGAMHGLARGEIRADAAKMDVYQSREGPDRIYPDGLITDEALEQLDHLAAAGDKPFFLAVGIIRPHLPFGAPQRYLDLYDDVEFPPAPNSAKPEGKTTWHGSSEFMRYNRWGKDPREDGDFASEVRRHYAACVSYADAQVGRIIGRLERSGAAGETVIVLWADHGWSLGEHAIWGKHSLFEEALRSPLVIVSPAMAQPGKPSDAVVETLDLFPTLCDLTSVPKPGFTAGVSLLPQLADPAAPGHSAVAYLPGAETIRDAGHRLIVHKDGHVELYDHASDPGETVNVAASQPEVVSRLREELARKHKP